MKWAELNYWSSSEWQIVTERLDVLTKKGVIWNPGAKRLFSSLANCLYDDTRVCIIGQDPYPNPSHATGVAFSIPSSVKETAYPPTLKNLLKEYCNDLHYPDPASGCLDSWCSNGVLLWNAYPSCEAFRSLSHHWEEWEPLTKEICERLDDKGIVFVLLGSFAQTFEKYLPRCTVLKYTHPSPLSADNRKGRNLAFLGSRLFSTINGKLCELGLDKIDWRL